jgi:MoaA/NifB/PqqE/SkfB family radical SAM enzyme
MEFALGRSLQHLIVHVTDACNLACAHCFKGDPCREELPLAHYRRIAGDVGRLLWLDIAGGEPFLRADLPDIIALFRADVVQIPTNGVRTDLVVDGIRRIRAASRSRIALSVSIDGFEEEHDRLRGSGSWAQAWRTFDAVRSLGVPVKINTVLSNRNVDTLVAFMEHTRQRHPDFHSVIFHRGTGRDLRVTLPPVARIREIMPEALRILGSYGYGRNPAAARILRNYHRLLWKLSLEIVERRRQVVPCLAGQSQLTIYADGGVSCCEMLPPFASVKDGSLAEIMASVELAGERGGIRAGRCSCTHNCALLDSVMFSWRGLLRLLHQPLPAAMRRI